MLLRVRTPFTNRHSSYPKISLLAYLAAYKNGVLHRDISINNILLTRVNGSVKGKLMDWDLSVKLERDDKGQLLPPKESRQRHRAVSCPFFQPVFS